jgi:hypothetical protein
VVLAYMRRRMPAVKRSADTARNATTRRAGPPRSGPVRKEVNPAVALNPTTGFALGNFLVGGRGLEVNVGSALGWNCGSGATIG